MNERKRLPERRFAETTRFEVDGHGYYLTVGYFPDDMQVGEIFINSSMKLGSMADINACDGAVAVSLALQYGCPLEMLRSGMKRNVDGSAQGPLGAALDTIMKGKG